ELRDLFADNATHPHEPVATYDYVDEGGTLLSQVCRFLPKAFKQRRPDGAGGWTWNLNGTRRVLYHLPELRAAVAAGKRVFVVEGEKDADAVRQAGYAATCNAGGAGKWRREYGAELKGADVGPEAVRWLWPGYLPLGKLVVLDGDPELGKSTVTLDLAARISAGRPMPDGTPTIAGGVVLLSAEDGAADTVRPRLDAAGAN